MPSRRNCAGYGNGYSPMEHYGIWYAEDFCSGWRKQGMSDYLREKGIHFTIVCIGKSL
jgi:hypothetical protein